MVGTPKAFRVRVSGWGRMYQAGSVVRGWRTEKGLTVGPRRLTSSHTEFTSSELCLHKAVCSERWGFGAGGWEQAGHVGAEADRPWVTVPGRGYASHWGGASSRYALLLGLGKPLGGLLNSVRGWP